MPWDSWIECPLQINMLGQGWSARSLNPGSCGDLWETSSGPRAIVWDGEILPAGGTGFQKFQLQIQEVGQSPQQKINNCKSRLMSARVDQKGHISFTESPTIHVKAPPHLQRCRIVTPVWHPSLNFRGKERHKG